MMRAMRPNRYSAAYGTNSTSNYTGYVADDARMRPNRYSAVYGLNSTQLHWLRS